MSAGSVGEAFRYNKNIDIQYLIIFIIYDNDAL